MSQLKWILLAAAGLVLGAGAALGVRQLRTTGTLFGPPSFRAAELTPPEPAPGFALRNASGQTVRLADFEGQIVALYFGYTYCPDVCPATLANLATAKRGLRNDEDQVQVIMITVDPERDSPSALEDYVKRIDGSFLGLTGSQEELNAVYRAYGIYVQKNEGSAESGYLVDHTASVIVIDKKGQWRLLFPFGMEVEAMQNDLKILAGE